MQTITDYNAFSFNGFLILLLMAALCGVGYFLNPLFFIPIIFSLVMLLSGFTIVQPNEAKVLTFLGRYVGSIKQSGFLYSLPFTVKTTIPLKLVNFVTDHLKVNDLNGNPIEIGAVVVWRVTDAAQAAFNVDDYRQFVLNQSDIALRTLAAHYPYDAEKETSLRGNIDEVGMKLKEMLQAKLSMAGITVEETKLSHLAYASEIAVAMLKRQQAVAIFQARQYMVQNALAIIDDVMKHFEKRTDITISDEKKADLINSLLIVMTSDKESSPVLNMVK